VTRSDEETSASPILPIEAPCERTSFDPGQTEIGQARNGATQAPRWRGRARGSSHHMPPREEKLLLSSQSSLMCGLHGLDECRSPWPSFPGGARRNEDDTRRDPGRSPLTRRSMKHGEGLRGLPRDEHHVRNAVDRPVGGAPSRSGFLATPIDASPRQALSVITQHPGRRDAVYAARRRRIMNPRNSKTARFMERDESRAERIQYPSRSGLGSVARSCRRKSPPGSEAVRRGESPSTRSRRLASTALRSCPAGHVSRREIEHT